jgi:DNA-binding beta-propeller fold protein YncE
VDFLKKNYLDHGKLGLKSSKGGLFPREPKLLVLDIGLLARQNPLYGGSIIEVSADRKSTKTLLSGQSLPDGIACDPEGKRMFWTCMGDPGADDGEVFSANVDGSDVKSIVPRGLVNTPKQLTVEPLTKKLYFCDREGMKVLRCNYDGSDFEVLINNEKNSVEANELLKWCVGIAVAPKLGKFYWTQKGPSKSGLGRIFCADIDGPAGKRTDIQVVLDKLPEPIDLEIDERTDTLYWTDRGELPLGNTVNQVQLNSSTGLAVPSEGARSYRILSTHFNEAIGIKLDVDAECMYVTDLGGTVYRCNLDGTEKEKVLVDEDRTFTGITTI